MCIRDRSWGGSGHEIISRKWSTYAASILLLKMGCSMTDLPFPLDRVLSSLLIKPFGKAGYHLLEFDATKIVCAVANLISCPGEMTDSAVVIASQAFLRQYRCWVFKMLCSPGGVERGKQWLCCSQPHWEAWWSSSSSTQILTSCSLVLWEDWDDIVRVSPGGLDEWTVIYRLHWRSSESQILV